MTTLLALLLALIIRTIALQPFSIPSGSMRPTLVVGDYLFVTKYSYGYSNHSLPFSANLFAGRILGSVPRRGDVVVFANPNDNGSDYVKRVVGLPGDHIRLRDGRLLVNGQPVRLEREGADDPAQIYRETLPDGRSYEIEKMTDQGFANNTPDYAVPPGALFTLGDNRDNSLDSRFMAGHGPGFVPIENVIGKAAFIYFSVEGDHAWWQFDKWPHDIRWSRVLSTIR